MAIKKRVNCSIDTYYLAQLDYLCEEYKCNRSELIELLCKKEMTSKRIKGNVNEEKVKECWDKLM